MADVPLLQGARALAASGFRPAGTERNETTFRGRIRSSLAKKEDYTLLCDAQTSGGLLIAISSERERLLVDRFRESGLFYARIGSVTDERGIVELLP
jgi:selenide,water dikinase